MTTAQQITLKTDRNGRQRAYRWSNAQMRSFPINYDKAVLLVAAGEAKWVARLPK